MPWFKVDDTLAFHRKTVAAGVPAMGLWVRAGSWCAQTLTDGFVPEHMVPALADGDVELAERLADAGLWHRVDGGFEFHEWDERQPSRKAIDERRAVRAAAGRKGGLRSGESRRSKVEASASTTREASASKQTRSKPEANPRSKRPSDGSSVEPSSQISAGVEANASQMLEPPTRPDPTSSASLEAEEPLLPARSARWTDGFDTFYAAYPRKVARGAAEKAWMKAVKNGADPQQMIAAAERYREERKYKDPEYTKHPSTWLNGKCYLDDPEPPSLRVVSGVDRNTAGWEVLKEPEQRALPGGS